MIHLFLHVLVPLLVAHIFYRPNWKPALLVLIATMIVDLDHLLANPIYDPERCSIGFHPLHTWPMIIVYAVAFILPLFDKKEWENPTKLSIKKVIQLAGLGLLIHMALDLMDCWI